MDAAYTVTCSAYFSLIFRQARLIFEVSDIQSSHERAARGRKQPSKCVCSDSACGLRQKAPVPRSSSWNWNHWSERAAVCLRTWGSEGFSVGVKSCSPFFFYPYTVTASPKQASYMEDKTEGEDRARYTRAVNQKGNRELMTLIGGACMECK